MFEALCEVDTKYTKFADKEYDAISAEVKKWFKKLVVSVDVPETLWPVAENEGVVEVEGGKGSRSETGEGKCANQAGR